MARLCLLLLIISVCRISGQESPKYSPYYKGPVCTPFVPPERVTDVARIQEIVRNARDSGQTVKAFGAKHSATDIICTNGIPLDMTAMTIISYNPDDQTVTVEPGVTLHALTQYLKTKNRALKTTPAYGGITIGGAIGTGAHGSSIQYHSSISEQVIGVTIVDGYGDIQYIGNDDPALHGFRVHLGLLGIVVSITLETKDLYKVRGSNTVISDSILSSNSLITTVQNADQISLYWFPSSGTVVKADWKIVDVNVEGNAKTNDHVPSINSVFNTGTISVLNTAYASEDLHLKPAAYLTMLGAQDISMQTLYTYVPGFAPIYTYDRDNMMTFANPAVGYYDDMFAPICDNDPTTVAFWKCPWTQNPPLNQLDNEFSVDIKDVPDVVKTVKRILSLYPAAFPLQGILLRFSNASESYMSTAYHRITCHFEFYMPMRDDRDVGATPGLAAYQTILQALLKQYHGRSHWGKSGAIYHSKENLALNLDPDAKLAFLELMESYDPYGVFLNDFGHRLKGDGDIINTDPNSKKHCALLDNCFCSRDDHCAPGQKCKSLTGFDDYRVCYTPNPLPIIPIIG